LHIINYNNPPPIDELRLKNLDKAKDPNGRYTWEKKYSVVAIFMQTGSPRETAQLAEIPEMTLDNWRKMPWWQQLVDDIKNSDATKLDNKLTKLINKSLSVIEDRLDNGEQVLNNKTGELVTKPVGIREATQAATALMQRQVQLHKNTVEQAIQKQTVQDTLKALATEFAKWTKNKDPIVLEETSDAIYETPRESGPEESSR
jgi:hypothetical protein